MENMKTLPRSIPLLMSRQLRPVPKDNIQVAFEKFHAANPEVYRKLVNLARTVKVTHDTYGIESLFARLRWHFEFETTGDYFKLNNNFRSRYARLVMEQEPDLKGFFRTRGICRNMHRRQVAA